MLFFCGSFCLTSSRCFSKPGFSDWKVKRPKHAEEVSGFEPEKPAFLCGVGSSTWGLYAESFFFLSPQKTFWGGGMLPCDGPGTMEVECAVLNCRDFYTENKQWLVRVSKWGNGEGTCWHLKSRIDVYKNAKNVVKPAALSFYPIPSSALSTLGTIIWRGLELHVMMRLLSHLSDLFHLQILIFGSNCHFLRWSHWGIFATLVLVPQ